MATGRGFYVRAPVSKALVIACTAATVAVMTGEAGALKSMNLSEVLAMRGAVGVFTSLGVFGSVSELVCGSYLFHTYRVLERHMGSAKYGSFLLFVTAVSWGAGLALCSRSPGTRLRPGPLPALGALWAFYFAYIPPLRPFTHVAPPPQGRRSSPLSDKTGTYIAALHIMLSSGWASIIPSAFGVAAACLYGSSALPFRRFVAPRPVRRLLSMFFGPLLDSEEPRAAARRRQLEQYRRQADTAARRGQRRPQPRGETLLAPGAAHTGMDVIQQGLRRRPVAPAPVPAPPEEAIEAVMALGFDRASAEAALRETGNNPDAAAARLLGL